MATKRTTKTSAGKAAPSARKRSTAPRSGGSGPGAAKQGEESSARASRSERSAEPGGSSRGGMAAQAKVMTPEEAFRMYRANAKIALEIIDAAIEETAKLR